MAKAKVIILSAVFVLALVIGMMQAPVETPAREEGSTFSAASLPVLCAELDGRLINPLYAYTEEMDPASVTESLYPFTDTLTMTANLLDSSARPQSVSYEVRDEAGGRLIERGTAEIFADSRGRYRFGISLQDLYEDETCYRLKFTVETGNTSGFYYTRFKKVKEETLNALTEYAVAFHDALFDKSAASSYSAKLEPNDQSDRNTLAFVDIHCSLDQVSWGSSGAAPASEAWMTIQMLQGDVGHFRFDYLANADAGGASPALIRCRETMTLQKNRKAMYLLEYERHAAQLWEASEDTVSAKGFLLGVQAEENVQVVSRGDLTAFALNGELYSYAAKKQKLTRIFSFRKRGENELRTLCGDQTVRIMSVEENGDIEFVVSGYMNGGNREGMCGAVYYTYEAESGELAENIAVASDKAPAVVQGEIARLFAKGNDHFLYFCLDRQIVAVDTSTGELAVLVGRNEFGSLVQNESGSAFAWQSGSDQTMPGSVQVMDLAKGTNTGLEAKDGEFIRALGYMREDLIVGRGKKADAPLDDGEDGRHPLYSLEILDEDLNAITAYSYPGIFLSGIEKDSERIIVHRYAVTDAGKYLYEEDDVLLRSDNESRTAAAGISAYTHETLKRSYIIPVSHLPSYLRLEVESSPAVREGRRLVLPEAAGAQTLYYAYGRGQLLGIYAVPGEAVALSAADYGYVTDAADGRLIWTWSPKKESKELSPGEIRTDRGKRLDLTGAAFRSLLYYLDSGLPVRWVSPDYGERWIVGYEWQAGIYYDPVTKLTFRMTQEDLEQAILRRDNYLWCYMD